MAEPYKLQMTVRRMRVACWVTKAADTNVDYVTLNGFSMATVVARTRSSVTS
jgi:hypothetical protein